MNQTKTKSKKQWRTLCNHCSNKVIHALTIIYAHLCFSLFLTLTYIHTLNNQIQSLVLEELRIETITEGNNDFDAVSTGATSQISVTLNRQHEAGAGLKSWDQHWRTSWLFSRWTSQYSLRLVLCSGWVSELNSSIHALTWEWYNRFRLNHKFTQDYFIWLYSKSYL